MMRERNARAAARIRDIPRSCSCDWRWSDGARRWVRTKHRAACSWHYPRIIAVRQPDGSLFFPDQTVIVSGDRKLQAGER